MLIELTVHNIAIIRETRIEFGPGMNALTGETGAGKSIVLDALGAVLGERTSSDIVRSGEERAYVEAIFAMPDGDTGERLKGLLAEYGIEPDPDGTLVLSRDILAAGRSTARVNGRALTAAALSEIGAELVDIHGQSDHLSLLRPATQLELLDRFIGARESRNRVAELYGKWRTLRREIENFDTEQRDRAQRLDLLQFQLSEIEELAPQPGEDEQLQQEASVLGHAEQLARLAAEAHAAFSGLDDDDLTTGGALDRLRVVEANLEQMLRFDAATEEWLTKLRDALFLLEEVDAYLRDYAEAVEVDPQRLEIVNQRLADLRDLTRKYGADLNEVLSYRDQIAGEIEQLTQTDRDIESLRDEEREAASELASAASELSQLRQDGAKELSAQVEQAIADLDLGRARFEVRLSRQNDASGLEIDGERVAVDRSGVDRATFHFAANVGEDPRPLARVASGGETARLMLALKSILSEADETPTLVFDEIDVGVGGRSGQRVGEKLWGLTEHHQVIVISHLPQVAAFADRHIAMSKHEADSRTETISRLLDHDASLDEIATMFDGKPVTPESRANAEALHRRVKRWKDEHGARRMPAERALL